MTALQLGGFRVVYATGEARLDREVSAEMDCPACAKRGLDLAAFRHEATGAYRALAFCPVCFDAQEV
jgi:hypothetical protein